MKIKTKLFGLLISFILLFSVNVKAEKKACEYKDETVNVTITIDNNNISNYQFFEYENKGNYVVQELANKSIINANDFASDCPSTIYYTKTDTCSRKKMGTCTNYNRYYVFYSSSNGDDGLVSLPLAKTIDNPQNNNTTNVSTNFFGSLSVVKCGNAEIPSTFPSIIRTIINLIKIAVPIVLIIMGMIDILKAVIASDEKKLATSQIQFFKRLLFGGCTFLVITVVQFIIGIVASDDATIINCVSCMVNDKSTCIAINKPVSNPDINKDDNDNPDDNNNKFITSSPDIKLTKEEYPKSSPMPYILYTPSSAKDNETTPLIVWLHGNGEINNFIRHKSVGLPAVLDSWSLDGFNAYVLCPLLQSSSWQHKQSAIYELIDQIIKDKNINTNKIILAGHSTGGIGVFQIAQGHSDFYSSLVVLSGYDPGIDLNEFSNIPTRGYYGPGDSSFMTDKFMKVFGYSKKVGLDHASVPKYAFNLDENKDNKSDIIEWMLTQ